MLCTAFWESRGATIAALKKKTQLIYQISVLKFQPIYVKKIYNHCYNDLNNINMEAEYILKMF